MTNTVNFDYSSLDLNSFERGLSAIIEVFIKIKDRILQNTANNNELITENIISNEKFDDINDFILTNLDILIHISRTKKEEPDESHILIRLREMLDFAFMQNELNNEITKVLINILESYVSFIDERIKMRENDDFSNYFIKFKKFEDVFSELEIEFYSLIEDTNEGKFEELIQETCDVLWEIE